VTIGGCSNSTGPLYYGLKPTQPPLTPRSSWQRCKAGANGGPPRYHNLKNNLRVSTAMGHLNFSSRSSAIGWAFRSETPSWLFRSTRLPLRLDTPPWRARRSANSRGTVAGGTDGAKEVFFTKGSTRSPLAARAANVLPFAQREPRFSSADNLGLDRHYNSANMYLRANGTANNAPHRRPLGATTTSRETTQRF